MASGFYFLSAAISNIIESAIFNIMDSIYYLLGRRQAFEIKTRQMENRTWNGIQTSEAAKAARVPALVFASFGTLVWAGIAIATIFGNKSIYGYFVFLYLAVFAVVTYGLFRMRRDAAIAYLVLSIAAVVLSWGQTTKFISAVAGVLVAILAVRGTFSYARLHRSIWT